MRLLEAQALDGFNETLIDQPTGFSVITHDGRNLGYEDLLAATPAVTSSYDGFYDPQLVLGTRKGLLHWEETEGYAIGRLDEFHGRNLEVLAGRIAISDEFGNEYHSLSIKGSDLSDPYFMESATASREFIINGLQESLVLERVLRASQTLRQLGIGTEYVCGLVLPEYFPFNPHINGIDDKTLHTLPEFLEFLATNHASEPENIPEGKSALEVKQEMIELFKDCDYLITYRAMDCPYRFSELGDSDKFELFKKFIAKNHDGPDLQKYLDELDPNIYILKDFAPSLGENVAKMHNAGITHRYLTGGNLSALASIVDLDSCRGEILGLGDKTDAAQKITNMAWDVVRCLRSLDNVIGSIEYDELSDVENSLHQQEVSYYAAVEFLREYLSTRSSEVQIQKQRLANILLFACEMTSQQHSLQLDSLSQRLFGAFCWLSPDKTPTATDDLPLFDTSSITPVRSSSFVRGVPSKFFAEKKQGMIDGTWNFNDEYPDLEWDREGDLNPAIKLACRDIALKYYLQHLFDHDYLEKPDDLMLAISSTLERDKNPSETAKKIKKDFDRVYAHVIECFSKPEQPPTNMYLAKLITEKLPDYLDRLGAILITDDYSGDNDENRTPTLFLESDSEFKTALDRLGINGSCEVIFGGMMDINLDKKDLEDAMILCDYKVAQKVSDQTTLPDTLNTVFGRRFSSKPTAFITGINSERPKVFVLCEEPDVKKEMTYQDLLERLCPSETVTRQQILFDNNNIPIHL